MFFLAVNAWQRWIHTVDGMSTKWPALLLLIAIPIPRFGIRGRLPVRKRIRQVGQAFLKELLVYKYCTYRYNVVLFPIGLIIL